MLSFALGPPLGQLWFLECGKLRVLGLVLVWVLELVGQEIRQSWSWSCLALLWVLHWVICGSLSVGSLGSWHWSWCVSPGVVGARIQAILELVMLSFSLGPPLGQLWFFECGKLRVLGLVLVWVLELVGQEFRQSWSWSCLALLWVLHWVNCGSLSVGSLGSWSWSWCGSWSWWGKN
jgi:hypothetical protein